MRFFSSCASLLAKVASDELSEDVLMAKLRAHVEAKDAELALSSGGVAGDEEADADGASASASAAAAGPKLFLGGMDTENMDFKCIYGADFKITYWQ